MNRTTTVVVALIAATSLSTMAYTVPAQRAFAWFGGGFGGCGYGCGGFFGGCGFGFGCGGPVFIHKTIIQTTSQTNNCHTKAAAEAASSEPPRTAASALKNTTSNAEDQSDNVMQRQMQNDNHVICLNTAVNNAGHGFGANGLGQGSDSNGLGQGQG
jgi:hypothetical protein